MSLYESIKNSLKESNAVFGIANIEKIFKGVGLHDINKTHNGYSYKYTFSGLYTVSVNEHFNNILFESYDLPITFNVNAVRTGEGKDTRTTGYSIKIIGFDKGLDVVENVSVYDRTAIDYTTKRVEEKIKDYADYVTYGVNKALKEYKEDIDKPEATSKKNGLYTEIALNKFITVVRDTTIRTEKGNRDKTYAPTNVVARLEDTPDYTDKGYNK